MTTKRRRRGHREKKKNETTGPVRCKECNKAFEAESHYIQHTHTESHQLSVLLNNFKRNRAEASRDKCGVQVTAAKESGDVLNLDYSCKPTRAATNSFFNIVAKEERAGIGLGGVYLLTTGKQTVISVEHESYNPPVPITLDDYRVRVQMCCSQIGVYIVPIVFVFQNLLTGAVFCITRDVTYRVSTSEVEEMEAREVVQHRPRVSRWNAYMSFKGYWPTKGVTRFSLQLCPMPKNPIPQELSRLLNHQVLLPDGPASFKGMTPTDEKERDKAKALLSQDPSEKTYRAFWHHVLWSEEHQLEVSILKYDMEGATFKRVAGNTRLYELVVPGLAEKRPSVLYQDQIVVRRSTPGSNRRDYSVKHLQYEGVVHAVRVNTLEIGFGAEFAREYEQQSKQSGKWDVHFYMTRYPLQNAHFAIDSVGSISSLFPPKKGLEWGETPRVSFTPHTVEMKSNGEQLMAVQSILNGDSLPYPFILFGPPGTGKTFTLVEAIAQLVSRSPSARLLVCGPSNSSCDVIMSRLLTHVARGVIPQENGVIRLYAASRARVTVSDAILPFSNMDHDGGVGFPDLPSLMKYRILVCTLCTAGKLSRAKFPTGHFTHLFIDEVSQATEPDTLIALSAAQQQRTKGGETLIVLSGDPRQLGPVVYSPLVQNSLSRSLMERLMENSPYTRDEERTLHYNPRYIVKLVNNFRSHSALLTVPNRLFYDSELKACAPELETERFISKDILINKAIPFIFHATQGRCQQEGRSPSFFNPEEAILTVHYVERLLRDFRMDVRGRDIGIITPYRGQVMKINKMLAKREKLEGLSQTAFVEVGTPEEFQGQERRVIIISTVRASEEFLQVDQKHKLGFLKNPKRFNVAITRARGLLIVIGNPQVLASDPHWRKLLVFAKESECCTGVGIPEEILQRNHDEVTETSAAGGDAGGDGGGLAKLIEILRKMNLDPQVDKEVLEAEAGQAS